MNDVATAVSTRMQRPEASRQPGVYTTMLQETPVSAPPLDPCLAVILMYFGALVEVYLLLSCVGLEYRPMRCGAPLTSSASAKKIAPFFLVAT